MTNRPFFILGCVRSGTTMMRNILRTHPQLASPEETHFYRWTYPYGSQSYINSILDNPTLQRHRQIDGITEMEMKQIINESFSRKQMMNKYMNLFIQKRGSRKLKTWFDKTPQNVYGISLLAKDFQAARFVNLVRNPLNVVASLKKGEVMKEKNLKGAINYWNEAQTIIEFAKHRMNKRLYVLRYEDFTANPIEELAKMGDFLEIDLSKITYDLDSIYSERNRFLDILGPAEIKLVVKHCSRHSNIYKYNRKIADYSPPKIKGKKEKLDLIDNWLSPTEKWNAEHIDFLDKDYLDVVCNVSAKSGSTNLYQGFLSMGKSSVHIHGSNHLLNGIWKRKNPPFHDFSYFDYLDYLKEKNPQKETLIIDVVREPISRKIAAFFQNLVVYRDRIAQISKNLKAPITFDKLIAYFEENTAELVDIFNKHYLLSLEQYFSFNEWEKAGVKVLEQSIDQEKKIWIQEKDWRKFLVLRFDEIANWSQTIQKLGYDGYDLPKKNKAEEKGYGRLYGQFKEQYKIPTVFLNLIYGFTHKKTIEHFYSAEEINGLKGTWEVYEDNVINQVLESFNWKNYLVKQASLSDKYKTEKGSLFHYCCYSHDFKQRLKKV